MDTNSKNKKNMLNRLLVGSVIVFISIVAVLVYKPIVDNVGEDKEEVLESYLGTYSFFNDIQGYTRFLYDSKIIGNQNTYYRYRDSKGIIYFLLENGEILDTNRKKDEKLLEDYLNTSKYNIRVEYIDGNIYPIDGSDIIVNTISGYMDMQIEADLENQGIEERNIEYIYIIDEKLLDYEGQDIFANDIKKFGLGNSHISLIFIIAGISLLSVLIFTLLYPYEKQMNIFTSKIFNKIYLEIKIFSIPAIVALFGLSLYTALESIFNLNGHMNIPTIIYDINKYFYIIGIPVAILVNSLFYLILVNIKDIYYRGIYQGLLKNSLVFIILEKIYMKLKAYYYSIFNLDHKEVLNRRVATLLALNILILLSSLLFRSFSILILIAYSIFIFKYILDFLVEMGELNRITRNIGQGNFSEDIGEDYKYFQSMFESIKNIRSGLDKAVERETKSERMKSELITNVSHDLKTPLTSIITYIDLLKDESIDQDTRIEYIKILEKKSNRLKVLIEDLFEASKLNTGNVELNLEEVDIVSLFRQSMGEMEEQVEKSDLTFKLNIPDQIIICELDGSKTYRVFENIINNIIKYSLKESRVYIDIIHSENQVEILFKNISAYEMDFKGEDILERFTRGDKSRNTEGSGLGLSIAESFVKLQGGILTVDVDGDLFKLRIKFKTIANS